MGAVRYPIRVWSLSQAFLRKQSDDGIGSRTGLTDEIVIVASCSTGASGAADEIRGDSSNSGEGGDGASGGGRSGESIWEFAAVAREYDGPRDGSRGRGERGAGEREAGGVSAKAEPGDPGDAAGG